MQWQYSLEELAAAIGATPMGTGQFTSISTDTRTLKPGEVFFALSGENFDGNNFVAKALDGGAIAAVTSRPPESHRLGCIEVPDVLRVLQDFAAYHRSQLDATVIAITGSCGKTSSKDLIAAVLAPVGKVTKTQGNLNNEIGCPRSLLEMDEGTRFGIIEMGANHVGEIARLCEIAQPDEAAITLVAPAHLEGFGSIEKVAKAKGEIAEGLPPTGCFYVNNDNPWCRAIGDAFPGEKVTFGAEGDVALRECTFDDAGEMVLQVDPVGRLRLPLPIRAQASNVLLAIAVGLRHGAAEFEAPLRAACADAARFRIEQVGPFTVIDDTYNANPASMAAALETLGERPSRGPRLAALGEMLELGDAAPALHRETGEAAGRHGVDCLFARGPHARDMIAGARAAGVVRAEALEDHAEIARALLSAAPDGGAILLKGSRGMQMEKVLAELRAQLTTDSQPPEEGGCSTT